MAISQSKFVSVSSTRTATGTSISGFGALLVCGSSANTGTGAKIETGSYDTYTALETALGSKMSTASKKAAAAFFSLSNGRAPLKVCIALDGSDATGLGAAITAVTGSWLIAFSGDYQDTVAGEGAQLVTTFATAVKASGGVPLVCTNVANAATAFGSLNDQGTISYATTSSEPEQCALIPSILATTDYTNTIKQYCFAKAGTLSAAVTDDTTYDTLVAANVNFMGEVKSFGGSKKFLMMGVCSDGTDLISYFGQCWLEEQCKANIMNLMSETVLTDGNSVGEVKNQVAIAASMGLANGVIVVGKQFSETEAANIESISGDAEAAGLVSDKGFWLDASIANHIVHYILIYADATGVKKVTGNHVIV